MVITAIVSILLASASTNADGAATAAASVDEAPPAKSAKICKSIKMTGSRVGVRTCKTKEQWEQGESAMELGQKGAKGTLAPPQFPTGS